MNKLKQYIRIMALFCLLVLMGCTHEEDLYTVNKPKIGDTSLVISVADGGFISNSENGTRATEVGYQTLFTNGDQIGLYAVLNGRIVSSCNNIALTYNGTEWEAPANTTLYSVEGARYYAYYPYQSSGMSDKIDASANNSDDFFRPLIANWTTLTDQSNYVNYSRSDLMAGSGIVGNVSNGIVTLKLTLNHRMALVIIKMPTVRYVFTNTNPSISNYYPSTSYAFNNFKPRNFNEDEYCYLINPGKVPANMGGDYNFGATKKKYIISNAGNIPAGNFKRYIVDGGDEKELKHTLSVGDYFMKDGGIIPANTSLTQEQKDNCIGIVFYVGAHLSDTEALNNEYLDKTGSPMVVRGYVVALTDVADRAIPWNDGESIVVVTSNSDTDYRAYYNTREIIKSMGGMSGLTSTNRPATYYCVKVYENNVPTPNQSSGWLFSSYAQLNDLFVEGSTKNIVKSNMRNTTNGVDYSDPHHWYTNSSEMRVDLLRDINSEDGRYRPNGRTPWHEHSWVRAIFVF